MLPDYCENEKGIFDLVPSLPNRGIDYAATVIQMQFQLLSLKYNLSSSDTNTNTIPTFVYILNTIFHHPLETFQMSHKCDSKIIQMQHQIHTKDPYFML